MFFLDAGFLLYELNHVAAGHIKVLSDLVNSVFNQHILMSSYRLAVQKLLNFLSKPTFVNRYYPARFPEGFMYVIHR